MGFIQIPSVGPATIIEIVWTLLAAIGAGFAMFGWLDASADLGVIRSKGIKNGRLLIARMVARMSAVLFTLQVLFLIVGLVVVTNPNPPQGLPIASLIVGNILISAEVLLIWAVFRDLQDRRSIIRRKEIERDEHDSKQETEI